MYPGIPLYPSGGMMPGLYTNPQFVQPIPAPVNPQVVLQLPQINPQIVIQMPPQRVAQPINPPPDQKENYLNFIFSYVSQQNPALAGKVTGMFMNMSLNELNRLVSNKEELGRKVQEAFMILSEKK